MKKITVVVNEKEVDVKLKDKFNEVNISRYIDKGLNKIAYYLGDDNINFSEYVEVFAVIKGAEDDE